MLETAQMIVAALLAWLPPSDAAGPQASRPATAAPTSAVGHIAVLVPRRAVAVAAPRAGTLQSVRVVLGQRVRAGEIVGTLEADALRLELAETRVALREAEGQREKAVISLDRAIDYLTRVSKDQNAFSESERKDAEFGRKLAAEELRIAESRVERFRVTVQRTEDLLARSVVSAPFDGTIAARAAEPGATVAPGSPIIRLISTEDLLVRFALPPDTARTLRPGDTVYFAGALNGAGVPVQVENIAPEIDAALQQVIVEAGVAVEQVRARGLKPGLDGYVWLQPPAR